MFERAACLDGPRLATAPFISTSALSALAALVRHLLKNQPATSNAPLLSASKSSHDQNRGEAHGHADIGAIVSNSGGFPSSTGPQQIDQFGDASAVATPAWRELPEQVRGALTNLLARLILEHVRVSQPDAGTEAGHDL